MADMKYDAVIIGSGLGGLVSACILAKNGMKVAVFEKHTVPGGCLQSFKRSGVSFETGMHYIGSMGEGETLWRYFKYLGINELPLSKLSDEAYEVISVGDRRYNYSRGHEGFIDTLSSCFSAKELRSYVDLCANVTSNSPMYTFGDHGSAPHQVMEDLQQSASGALESITSDALLRDVLAGIQPLYAGVEGVTPLYIHALIWEFYNRGAYRIIGGSECIATSLCNVIRSMGGDIFTGCEVQKINVTDGTASSITVDGIGEVECRSVISDIHPQLLLDLVGPKVFRRVYDERIRSLRQTVSNFTVYIKFKPGRVPYLGSNFYHYGHRVWDCADYTDADWPRNFLYMHQCSSADQKYATHAILLSYMKWADVEKWSDTRMGCRGQEYLDFKETRKERLLDALEAEFPGTKDAIESCWTSSPLTYRDYTGTVEGSMYGIVRNCSRLEQTAVSQRTKVSNLYLAGQNINTHGVLGVTIGSVLACSELLGYDYLMTQIKNQTI